MVDPTFSMLMLALATATRRWYCQ